MIKLIWISDCDIKGFEFWLLKRISITRDYYRIRGEQALELVNEDDCDFLIMDLQRPANTDMMDRQCLRYINRLRVSVFTLKPVRSRILQFFFPPDVIKTIASNIINHQPINRENH